MERVALGGRRLEGLEGFTAIDVDGAVEAETLDLSKGREVSAWVIPDADFLALGLS